MYRLIFSDLDETLLTSDHHVPLINREAIAKARQKGVKFIPTTGRGYEMTREILQEIGIDQLEDEYEIAFNGGMIVECKNFRELLFQGLDYDTVYSLYQFGKDYDVCIEVFTPEGVYLFHANDDEIARKTKQKANFKVIEGDDISFLKKERLAKIIFEKIDMPYLHELAKKMTHLTEGKVQVSYSSSRYLEFNQLGVSKGQALAWLADYLHVPIAQTIAIGDNENDIPMIQSAGLGVAVQNAEAWIQDLADTVTKARFDQGAVAEVIEKYILSE